MSDYALSIAGWENEEHRYPNDKPYALREQHQRPPGELTKVVLEDISDVLFEFMTEIQGELEKANNLVREAHDLDEDDENYYEYLQDILQQAEQLDHVHVEWDGDAGMVSISISDYWYTVEDASND